MTSGINKWSSEWTNITLRQPTETYLPNFTYLPPTQPANMREIVHLQAGQCGNQIGAKVSSITIGPLKGLSQAKIIKKIGDFILAS